MQSTRLRTAWCLGLLAGFWLAGCTPRGVVERTPPPPSVIVAEARRMNVPILANPIGTTAALEQISIRARVRGFLKEQHFEEGADVKKGQLLFVIDEDSFQAQLDADRASLAEAQAALDKATQSKAREIAQAQVAIAEATLEQTQIEEKRERALYARNASTIEDVERKVTIRKRAVAQVESDKASLEQSKADYDVNIHSVQAQIAAAKAAVRVSEINLGYCRMESPIGDGRVGDAKVKIGNLVGPSAGSQEYTELTTVKQLDPMGIDIQVSSRNLDRAVALVREGVKVKIVRPGIESDLAHPFEGVAYFIDNVINPSTSTFLSKARVANPDHVLLPGEYVKVEITIGQIDDAVVVPEQAVVETQAGPTVFALDSQEKVELLPVKASIVYEGLRVIESGLAPGRSVIVEGIQLVRPGMKVKVDRAARGTPPPPVAMTSH